LKIFNSRTLSRGYGNQTGRSCLRKEMIPCESPTPVQRRVSVRLFLKLSGILLDIVICEP